MSESTPVAPELMGRPSSSRVLWTVAAAFVTAAFLLVTMVLPAEYGIDPLGTGQALGLLRLANVPTVVSAPVVAATGGPLSKREGAYRADTAEFSLLPSGGFVEYHYHLEKGAAMLFEWAATGALELDFHAQADGAPSDVAETFEKGRARSGRGSYLAPYTGLHGWYWENRTNEVVRITLSSTGFFDKAVEFRDDGTSVDHPLGSGAPPARPNEP